MFFHRKDAAAHIRFKIGFFGGKTNLAAAFTAARSLFTPEAGARDVDRLVVTFTDGGSNIRDNETLPRATGIFIPFKMAAAVHLQLMTSFHNRSEDRRRSSADGVGRARPQPARTSRNFEFSERSQPPASAQLRLVQRHFPARSHSRHLQRCDPKPPASFRRSLRQLHVPVLTSCCRRVRVQLEPLQKRRSLHRPVRVLLL